MNEIERAIAEIEGTRFGQDQCHESTMRLAHSALKEKLSRQENAPLTLKEIKELYEASFSGYPVWCRYLDEYSYPFAAVIDRYDGEIVAVHAAGLKDDELNREEYYGQTWLAYRYEPKGEPNV